MCAAAVVEIKILTSSDAPANTCIVVIYVCADVGPPHNQNHGDTATYLVPVVHTYIVCLPSSSCLVLDCLHLAR